MRAQEAEKVKGSMMVYADCMLQACSRDGQCGSNETQPLQQRCQLMDVYQRRAIIEDFSCGMVLAV